MEGESVAERVVTTDDGVQLHTRADGREGARGLLLCNALGTALDVWEPQVESWAATRRVVRFDARGHGRSQVAEAPFDLDRLGRDALAVLDAHDQARVDVCGASLGGLVALWLALHAPDRVRRLVLAATAARVGTEADWHAHADDVQAAGMDALAEGMLERAFSPAFRAGESPWVGRLGGMLRAAPVAGYAGACRALATADVGARLHAVRAPALVIVGSEDVATPPPIARELADALPTGRLVEIAGAGHLVHLEAPDRFAELVADFCSGARAADPLRA